MSNKKYNKSLLFLLVEKIIIYKKREKAAYEYIRNILT